MNKQSLQHESPGVTPGAWRKGHKYPSFPRHSFFSSLTVKEKSSGIAQPPDKKKKRRRRRKGRGGEGKGEGEGKRGGEEEGGEEGEGEEGEKEEEEGVIV